MAVTSTPPRRDNPVGTPSTPSTAKGGAGRSGGSGVVVSQSWRQQGNYSTPPSYPDTSYQAYLQQGGNILGIGYFAWKDRLINNYNQDIELWNRYYNSAEQQVERLNLAGLNTNLAYGQVTPGGASAPGAAVSQAPSPLDVATGGAQILSGLFGNLKVLAEAATIINTLPESKFKGNLARQLDVAAAAAGINTENTWQASVNSERLKLGAAGSKAKSEVSGYDWSALDAESRKAIREYLMSHDSEGSPASLEDSVYGQSQSSQALNSVVEYNRHKAEYDYLFSHPEYWNATIQKLQNEATITSAQAQQIKTIMEDPNFSDPLAKFLALNSIQSGPIGAYHSLAYTFTSALLNAFEAGKERIRGIKFPWNKSEDHPRSGGTR